MFGFEGLCVCYILLTYFLEPSFCSSVISDTSGFCSSNRSGSSVGWFSLALAHGVSLLMCFTIFDCELMFLGTLSENSLRPGWKSHSSREDMCLLYQMPGDTTNPDSLTAKCSTCGFLGPIEYMPLAPHFVGFFLSHLLLKFFFIPSSAPLHISEGFQR